VHTAALTVAKSQGADLSALSPRSEWMIDPSLTYLNHGAFGAASRRVRAVQDDWRVRIEANPAAFTMYEQFDLLAEAAVPLAAFVGTAPNRLALVENATAGMAAVLSGIGLNAGDRIVTTSHVYGAIRNMLTHLGRERRVIVDEIALPAAPDGPKAILAPLGEALDQPTSLLVIDHIASPSALVMPLAEIIELAHARGVAVLVDGSHAPGMLDLDIDALGAEWYVGNCHKWLCAPKGAAFIAISPTAKRFSPLVVSHAYGAGFPAEFRKVGTRDPSAMLSIPEALALHADLGGANLRQRNRMLAAKAAEMIAEAIGGTILGPAAMRGAMASISLPGIPAERSATEALAARLRTEHRIEVLCLVFGGTAWVRLSAHAYNGENDYAALAAALKQLLPGEAHRT
jgi:isopenicillin-N epimerase